MIIGAALGGGSIADGIAEQLANNLGYYHPTAIFTFRTIDKLHRLIDKNANRPAMIFCRASRRLAAHT